MKDFLAGLNEEQRVAVTAPLGSVLVLAGAGSGKTRVLTFRIAYLLGQKTFRPADILALTFTNKAAGEMRERIEKLLGGSIAGKRSGPSVPVLTMGTFHSVCARLLRVEIEKLNRGYDHNFVIYDTDDALRLLKQITLELGISERIRPQVLAYYISAAKNRLTSPAGLALESSFVAETLEQVYELYEKNLQKHNALDFDDLLRLTCELFMTHPAVLAKYRKRFKYVLVDEYQDTNHAQYMFLKFLVEEHQNLFVVGDDAQSIYGFRGANMQNILDFQKDYPKATVVMLQQNYRSTQTILDAAAEVIKLNPTQYEKKLWTENSAGSKINLYEAADELDESSFVLRQILRSVPYANGQALAEAEAELVYEPEATPILDRFFKAERRPAVPRVSTLEMPADLGQNVVLYRTHAQSRPLEEVFLTAGVPYQIIGGIKFYERKEIKDVISYLRLLLNPRDLVSLARIINLPARGIGPANLKTLTKAFSAYEHNYTRLLRNVDELSLQPKALAGARDFLSLYVVAKKLAKTKTLPEVMHLMLNRSGYKDQLLDGSTEGEARWENIEELFNVAVRYKHLPWAEGLQAFLQEVALMTDLDSMEEQGNKLTLMTLHSAKGLEFENVFMVGLEEGLLPHSRALLSPQEIAEEVRLAYVGITRAKQNLYLSYARQRQTFGETKRAIPSRILKAIPKKLINKIPNFSIQEN
jgi:DNA helicase-2/ATP-dependent DNA helicase PcrA